MTVSASSASKHQPTIGFEEVDHLNGEDRGGIGSTGKR